MKKLTISLSLLNNLKVTKKYGGHILDFFFAFFKITYDWIIIICFILSYLQKPERNVVENKYFSDDSKYSAILMGSNTVTVGDVSLSEMSFLHLCISKDICRQD